MAVWSKLAERKVELLEVIRRLVQLGLFVLFNAGLMGLAATPILLPILIPSATPGRTVGNAFSAMEYMLSEAIPPLIPLAVFLAIGAVFGRALCAWACPFGLVQDLLVHVKRKPVEVAAHTHRSAIRLKYYILAICALISWTLALSLVAGVGEDYKEALGPFAYGPFTTLSPAETLFSLLPAFLVRLVEHAKDVWAYIYGLPALFWARLVLMGAVLVLVAYVPRAWCRYLCPVGALLAIFGRFSLLSLRINPVKCDRCGACVRACPMMVRLLEQDPEKISDPECIYCLRCLAACPNGAIRLRMP
ncbi:hypothetical protein DRO60_00430 [Candidatus Bathyarchaeota archaeon]|nr:MAG: hypothetical protein DRO60_00430 [Candidatus Bathyarchaeota archaeon]